MVKGRLPGQTGAIFHFRPYGRFPGSGKGFYETFNGFCFLDSYFPESNKFPWENAIMKLDFRISRGSISYGKLGMCMIGALSEHQ